MADEQKIHQRRFQLGCLAESRVPSTPAQALSSQTRIGFQAKLAGIVLLSFLLLAQPHAARGEDRWISVGPEGGNITALALDPRTPTTLYAGTYGGVFKSVDGGVSWQAANTGLPTKTFAFVLSLVLDPTTPTTLYAGTGVGVFKSTTAGMRWEWASNGLASCTYFYGLSLDPTTPTTLYVATNVGVFKSTDGGADWQLMTSGLPTDRPVFTLALHPTTSTTLYAGTFSDGVFKTVDGGGSWHPASNGLTNPTVLALAVDPTTPTTLYAGTGGGGVFKSSDGGASWQAVNTGLTNTNISALAIARTTLYAGTGGGGVFKSSDGGASWQAANTGLTAASVSALAVDPTTPTTLYAGTGGGGVFKSSDGGASWQAANTGLTAASVSALAFDPRDPRILYVGTAGVLVYMEGGGVFKSTDGGASWQAANTGLPTNTEDVLALALDPKTPTTLYAGTWRGVFKSTDGGASWQEMSSGLPTNAGIAGITALALDPTTPTTLYAGNGSIYRSTNGGTSWQPASSGLPTDRPVLALALDPKTPTTLYAGTWRGVFKTTNSGASWQEMSSGLATNSSVPVLVVDPTNPATLYAGMYGGVFKSTDGGVGWQAVSGLTNSTVLALDPTTPATLYAGTGGGGVFKSTDGGVGWQAVNTGLTNTNVSALALARTTLYAGTVGGGVFVLRQTPVGMISVTPLGHDFGSVNPGASSWPQTFTVSNAGSANLTITSLLLDGPDATSFIVQRDVCSNQILVPSSTCSLQVVFSPTSYGVKTAALSIPSNDPTNSLVTVVLQGTGGATGNSSISGRVFDVSTGLPIADAQVRVGSMTGQTSPGGQYSITEIPPGDYTVTVARRGYAILFEFLSVPPLAGVQRSFSLQPLLTSGITVLNVASKYLGHVYYLDGIDHLVTFTANEDWGGHPPGKVRFTTPNGSYEIATTSTVASRSFNMGTEFGPCGGLKARAIAIDEVSSPDKRADLVVMSGIPYVPGFRRIDVGGGFSYNSSIGFNFTVFDQLIDAGAIPEDIPLFGKQGFGLRFLPSVTAKITSDGAARYDLDWDNKPVIEGEMAGLDFALTPKLAIEGRFDEGTCKWAWSGSAGGSGSVGISGSWPFIVLAGPIPIPMYAKAGLDLSAGFTVGIVDLNPISLNGQLSVNPQVRGALGVGVDELLAVEGWVGGGVGYTLQWPQLPTQALSIMLDAGVSVYGLLFKWENELLHWDWSLGQAAPASSKRDALPGTPFPPRLAPRDYLTLPNSGRFDGGRHVQRKKAVANGKPYTTATAPIQSTVFPYSEPNLASSGDHLYLVWLTDNPNRTAINRSMAVFSSWDGSAWQPPKPIADDGTANFHPQILAFPDGSALVAWEDVQTILPDTATFADVVANLEIATAIYDPQSKQWRQAQRLTTNSYLDRSPKLAGHSTTDVLLVWIANEGNDLRGSASNPNALYAAKWDGTAWSSPQAVATIPYPVLKYGLVYDGTKGDVVLSLDTGQDPTTIQNHELFLVSYTIGNWGSLARLTTDTVADDNPQLAIDANGDVVLVWLRGDELSSVVNFAMKSRQVVAPSTYSTNLADFKLASTPDGTIALLWAEPTEFSSDLHAMLFDPIFKVWGSPKRLTFDPETEKYITAAFYGGHTLVAVYDRTQVGAAQLPSDTSGGAIGNPVTPVPGTTDLYMVQHVIGGDLAVDPDSLGMVPPNPRPGDAVTLTVTVANQGDMAVKDVPVTFYWGNPSAVGTAIGSLAIADTLAPGDTKDVAIPWIVPMTTTALDIYAVVDPEQIFEDSNRANNVVSGRFVKPDLTIQTAWWEPLTTTLLSITARVLNQGSLPASATMLTFRRDSGIGPVLSTQSVAALNPDQSVDVNFLWNITGLSFSPYVVHMAVDEANAIDEFDKTNNAKTLVMQLGADLALTETAFPDPAIVGSALTYTLSVTNAGPSLATGLTLTDPLPGAVTLGSATATQGTCNGTSTVTCNLGSLAAGASATVTVVVTPTTAGPLINTASVSATETDPNPANNTASVGTMVKIQNPTLILLLNQPSFHGGQQLTLMATVTPGAASVAADAYVAVQLPDGSLLFLQGDGSLTSVLQPIVRNWTIGPFSGQLFSYTFSGGEPVGNYAWLAAFTQPGTLNFIGPIVLAPFSFSP